MSPLNLFSGARWKSFVLLLALACLSPLAANADDEPVYWQGDDGVIRYYRQPEKSGGGEETWWRQDRPARQRRATRRRSGLRRGLTPPGKRAAARKPSVAKPGDKVLKDYQGKPEGMPAPVPGLADVSKGAAALSPSAAPPAAQPAPVAEEPSMWQFWESPSLKFAVPAILILLLGFVFYRKSRKAPGDGAEAPTKKEKPEKVPKPSKAPKPAKGKKEKAGGEPAAPASPPQGVFCGECGTPNDPGSAFCETCGAPMSGGAVAPVAGTPPPPPPPSPPPRVAVENVCGTCGAKNEPGAMFCEECGASLAASPAPTAAVAESKPAFIPEPITGPDSLVICKDCGAPNDSRAKFCEECGAPLKEAAEPAGVSGPDVVSPPEPGPVFEPEVTQVPAPEPEPVQEDQTAPAEEWPAAEAPVEESPVLEAEPLGEDPAWEESVAEYSPAVEEPAVIESGFDMDAAISEYEEAPLSDISPGPEVESMFGDAPAVEDNGLDAVEVEEEPFEPPPGAVAADPFEGMGQEADAPLGDASVFLGDSHDPMGMGLPAPEHSIEPAAETEEGVSPDFEGFQEEVTGLFDATDEPLAAVEETAVFTEETTGPAPAAEEAAWDQGGGEDSYLGIHPPPEYMAELGEAVAEEQPMDPNALIEETHHAYEEAGHHYQEAEHSAGFDVAPTVAFETPEEAVSPGAEGIVCGLCGEFNPPENATCFNCGADLSGL